MTAISFKAATRSRLLKAIESDDITCEIDLSGWAQFNRANPFYAMLLGSERSEIILVTGGTGGVLTIERGQEGTSGLDWPKQTLIFQQLTAETFSQVEQLEAFRQGAYNPNGALASLYFGEKFYQSDDALWWKSVAQGSTEWRLIAGEVPAEDPEFIPPPGTWEDGQSLEMRTFYSGAEVRYTTDGTNPTETSTLYVEPFVMPTGTSTYKAKNFGGERWEQEGNIVEGTYFLDVGTRAWEFAGAAKVGTGEGSDIIVFGEYLYGLSIEGYLLRFDYVLARWDIVANPPGAPFSGNDGRWLWKNVEGTILYMGAIGGNWYYWNGEDAWVAVYTGGSFFYPPRPVWFNDTWYSSFETGIHHWNGSSWVSDGFPGTGTTAAFLAVLEDELYISISIGDPSEAGKMYRFDDPGYTQVAGIYPDDGSSVLIWEKDNEIYGNVRGLLHSYIYQWNKVDSWIVRATSDYPYSFSPQNYCLLYNTMFFTDIAGRLYYWNQVDTNFKMVASAITGYEGPIAAFKAPDRDVEEIYMINTYTINDNNRLLRWQ